MKILKLLWKHFHKFVLNERGTWAGWGVALGAGSLGLSAFGMFGGGGKKGNQDFFRQLPDYPEATGARQDWWKKLQEWGNMPGYGAISPEWGDIWERAKSKINRYYWGGPQEGAGLAGNVRASAARRGVSQSPALESELSRMGMAEGIQQKDLATEMATQEATFSESGRQNWLSSMMNMANLKPSFTGVPQQPNNMLPLMGGLGESLGTIYGQQQQEDWLTKLMKSMGTTPQQTMPTTTQGSLINIPSLSGSQGPGGYAYNYYPG